MFEINVRLAVKIPSKRNKSQAVPKCICTALFSIQIVIEIKALYSHNSARIKGLFVGPFLQAYSHDIQHVRGLENFVALTHCRKLLWIIIRML